MNREALKKAVDQADTRADPMPHSRITEFFDPADFRNTLSHWPGEDAFETLSLNQLDYPERRLFQVSKEKLASLPQETQAVWLDLLDGLADPKFLSSLMGKFPDIVAPRLKAATKTSELTLDIRLIEDASGYALGPHTDVPYKLFTLLVYMPEDEKLDHLGTSFYRPISPGFVSDGVTHHERDDFELIDTISYRPNTALLFPRTDVSFHGVEAVDEPGYIRRLIVMNVYLQDKVA